MSSFKEIHPRRDTTTNEIKKGENVREVRSAPALLRKIEELNTDPAIAQLITQCRNVLEGEERYVEETCPPESALQQKIVQETYEDKVLAQWTHMLSGKVVGSFIKTIAEVSRAKKIMEIGMFTGYSAVTFAETSHCEEMVCLEIDPDMEKFVQERIKGTAVDGKIRILVGPALESLVKLKANGEKFDLVYIDANKSGYMEYYKYIMDNNLLDKSTGVILCDNILWSHTTMDQSTPNGKILHDFVQYVLQDERVIQMLIPVSDGIFLIKPKT